MTPLNDFSRWAAPAELVSRFEQAAAEQRYLNDADLVALALARLSGALPTAARQIREEEPRIADQWLNLYPDAQAQRARELIRALHFAIANGRPDCFTPDAPTPTDAALAAVVRKCFPPEVQAAIAPVLSRLEPAPQDATAAADHG